MSDTDMTLDEAVRFLNEKRGSRGRPPKEWSARKDLAVKIVNAATASGKLKAAPVAETAPKAVKPVAAKTSVETTQTVVAAAETVTPTKTQAEQKKDDDTINSSLASLNDTPTGVQW